MHMGVAMGMSAIVMGMDTGFERDWNEVNLAMNDTALGDHAICEGPHLRGRPAKNGNFEAILMIKVNVHGRYLQVVVRMLFFRQARCQVTRMMIKAIGQGRNALAIGRTIYTGALQTKAREVPEGLRPVVVMMLCHEGGELIGERVRHADRHAFH